MLLTKEDGIKQKQTEDSIRVFLIILAHEGGQGNVMTSVSLPVMSADITKKLYPSNWRHIFYTISKLPEIHLQKIYITNKDDNIIRVCSTSIILLIFMSDIFYLYMSNEGYFAFIITILYNLSVK